VMERISSSDYSQDRGINTQILYEIV
jgi:hypothetical protein